MKSGIVFTVEGPFATLPPFSRPWGLAAAARILGTLAVSVASEQGTGGPAGDVVW